MPFQVFLIVLVIGTAISRSKVTNESFVSSSNSVTDINFYWIENDDFVNKSNHDETSITTYSEEDKVHTHQRLEHEQNQPEQPIGIQYVLNDDEIAKQAKRIDKRSLKKSVRRPLRRRKRTKTSYEHIKSISKRKCHEYKDMITKIDRKTLRDGGSGGIVGGKATSIVKYPHMGAIGWKFKGSSKLTFLCGSALISNNFIITAAHCSSKGVRNEHLKPRVVRFGTTRINVKVSKYDYGIRKIFKHPKYKSPLKYYDIALMLLDRDVDFNRVVKPACIWRTNKLTVPTATLTGWGTMNKNKVVITDNEKINHALQEAEVCIIDKDTCAGLLVSDKYFDKLHKHQLCAGVLSGGIDSCKGDSGGPLQVVVNSMYYVVGIISFGLGCGGRNSPGVYTRVSSFVSWIEKIVWETDYGKD